MLLAKSATRSEAVLNPAKKSDLEQDSGPSKTSGPPPRNSPTVSVTEQKVRLDGGGCTENHGEAVSVQHIKPTGDFDHAFGAVDQDVETVPGAVEKHMISNYFLANPIWIGLSVPLLLGPLTGIPDQQVG
jgi:hypothetical protein